MLKISLEQWRMFHAVVKYGGFNQAAQNVYKSQSSIHNAVTKIESSLDVKLFSIQGRKTVLTDPGKMVLRKSLSLLEEAYQVETIGRYLGQGIETYLNIAVDEIFPRHFLYQVLDSVSLKYPLVQIELQESTLNGASELFENGVVDIAISPKSFGFGKSASLCHIPFISVAAASHPLHQLNRTLTLDDLKHYRQIVVRDSSHWNYQNRMNMGWLESTQRWTVSHMQSSIDLIIKGFGFSWLPKSLIIDALKDGRLLPLKLNVQNERITTLYLTSKDKDSLGPVTRYFLEQLRKHSKKACCP